MAKNSLSVRSAVNTIKENRQMLNGLTPLVNPKESLPKFIDLAKSACKDHSSLSEEAIKSETKRMECAQTFYSDSISSIESIMKEVDLSSEERKQLLDDIRRNEDAMEKIFTSTSVNNANTVSNHRQFIISIISVLLFAGSGVGYLTYAVKKS